MKSIQAATYLVHFQEQAYLELNTLIAQKKYSTLFILVDENTFEHCYSKFIPNLDTDKTIEVIEIESGEINKNIETCVGVWNAITELGGDRKSLLITLGGGVITDLGGFVASTFKRGIDFVNIPTTLLSMVDAAVGGKTGVDLGVLKNQIGLFSNPEMVLIDTAYLTTVTDREMKSGMAEIIKYGLTYDLKLFNHIKEYKGLHISDLIFRSIQIKNEIVLQDPTEKNIRKVFTGHKRNKKAICGINITIPPMPEIIPSATRFVSFPPPGNVVLTQSANKANELSIKSIGMVAQSYIT